MSSVLTLVLFGLKVPMHSFIITQAHNAFDKDVRKLRRRHSTPTLGTLFPIEDKYDVKQFTLLTSPLLELQERVYSSILAQCDLCGKHKCLPNSGIAR